MKIRTIWQHNPDEPDVMPWILDAVDEYTEEECNGLPDRYPAPSAHRRELIIDIPESAVRNLFAVPEVKGEVK